MIIAGCLMLLFIYAVNNIQAEDSKDSKQQYDEYNDSMPPPPPQDFDPNRPQRGHRKGMRPGGPGGPGMGPGWFGEHFDENSFEHGKRYEKLRMMKMFVFLELDDTTRTQILDYMVEQRKIIRSLIEEKNQLVDQLARMVKEKNYTERELDDQINKVIKNKEDFVVHLKSMFKNMRSMLTDEQVAKFLIFNERFDQRLFDEIRQMNPRSRPNFVPEDGNGK